MATHRLPDIVAAARRLAPAVRAAREEAEQTRQTPPALAAAITEAGIYQMYLPRSMGGPETPPLTAFRVVEELSIADGSVGWCAMIATALSLNAGRLPPEVGREMAGTPADYRGAGSARRGTRLGGRRRISREGSMEFRQRHPERELVVLHLRHDGWRHAVSDRGRRSVAARGLGAAGSRSPSWIRGR